MKKCIQSSLSDQVSTMLKEQILNGQLKGGEKERCKALIHEHVFHRSIDLGALDERERHHHHLWIGRLGDDPCPP